MSLPALFRAEKERILASWEAIVCSLSGARQLSDRLIRNQMPGFLDWLIGVLEQTERSSAFPHEQALQHASKRVNAGYDLSEVISEYAVLRDCLLETWERHPRALSSARELRLMNQAIDEAIAYTAVVYARIRLFSDRRSNGDQHKRIFPRHGRH
jgi:hypothetical protein